jgi:hypothetical protein
MKRSSGPRKTASNLSESVHQQLNMYAIAAGAAGVGVFALAQPSEAKIVYTPAHTQLRINVPFYFDVNHDGTNDFQIQLATWTGTSNFMKFSAAQLRVIGSTNLIVDSAGGCAAALPKGTRIGPKSRFLKHDWPIMFEVLSTSGRRTSFCPWRGQKTQAYLGLKFHIMGKTHFGWARFVTHSDLHHPTAELTGYAYETIAGKSIIAGQTTGTADDPTNEDFGSGASLTTPIPDKPQPASLGMLALGAQGVPLWRRKETQEVIGR